jgi:hypothetical protein
MALLRGRDHSTTLLLIKHARAALPARSATRGYGKKLLGGVTHDLIARMSLPTFMSHLAKCPARRLDCRRC